MVEEIKNESAEIKEEDIEMLDFVGAIYAELVEMNQVLCQFLKAAAEEKASAKEKKELGFKIGADAGAGKAKGGISPISKIFGNAK